MPDFADLVFGLVVGLALTFIREGDELITKGGQSISELQAESNDRFYYAPFSSVITFVKNEKGAVDHITFSVNGRDYEAARQP